MASEFLREATFGVTLVKEDKYVIEQMDVFKERNYLYVKYRPAGGGASEVVRYDMLESVPGVVYKSTSDGALLKRLQRRSKITQHIILSSDTDEIKNLFLNVDGRHLLYQDRPYIAEDYTKSIMTPLEEPAEYFKDRMMLHLHRASKAFSDQLHHNLPHLTGNAENILHAVKHSESNQRFQTAVNAFRAPIGYIVYELNSTVAGYSRHTRSELLKLCCDIEEVCKTPDIWWDFYRKHDSDAVLEDQQSALVWLPNADPKDEDNLLNPPGPKPQAAEGSTIKTKKYAEYVVEGFREAVWYERDDFIKERELTEREVKIEE